MEYGYKKQVDVSFGEAEAKARGELSKHGFGVITEIDVKKTFKNKLNKEFENYVILGACHPDSAYAVLSADKDLGLLLPCNVIVYEDAGKVFISAIMPKSLMEMLGDSKLAGITQEIDEKLKSVVDAI